MTHTAAIIRQLDAPPLAKRTGIAAAAIVADVDAIAAEWSVRNDLAMISAETVASRNAEAIIIEAAVRILARAPKVSMTVYRHGTPHTTRAAGLALADALQAYQDGVATNDAAELDAAAEALDFFADEAAEWFRLQGAGA